MMSIESKKLLQRNNPATDTANHLLRHPILQQAINKQSRLKAALFLNTTIKKKINFKKPACISEARSGTVAIRRLRHPAGRFGNVASAYRCLQKG